MTEPSTNPTRGSKQLDPEQLTRLLDIELIQKRAAWQQTTARHKQFKSLSLFFLFIVILAALVGLYFAFPLITEQRGSQHPARNESQTQPGR